MAVLAALGVVTSFLGPAMEFGKLIAAQVGRQLNYLCCFSSNITTLEEEAKSLDDATSDLQGKIDPAINNAQRINSTVETWLEKSIKAKTETKEILDEAPNVGSGCSKLGKRYSLSKKATKTTITIKELVGKCNFTEISHPPPAAASAPIQSGTTMPHEFESRREIEEEIMKSLGDKNVIKIGICGMGGLGKTTMAEKIMERAREEGLFGEVVKVIVSQPVDKLNIQLQISEQLGLEFKDEAGLISRANLLRDRLRGKKKTLLVFDDVWDILNIEELGIPREDGCKVLFTSRDKGVLIAMDVGKVCEIKILDEEEAWMLFRGKAGTCVDDDAELNHMAKDVMRECKGLPLALVTVGMTLKEESNISIWEDALGQLRRSNPTDIPSIIEQVYNPLKLSYDRLGNPNTKLLFLMCCLFPEDYQIPLEPLVYFATGLHLFQDIRALKEVRGRTSALVKTLKTRGLLLDGSDDDHVRMHDVARDVSVFIASKEGRIKCSDCTWISSHVDGGPSLNNAPKLKLLLMNDKAEVEQEMDSLIGGSTELNVLFIEQHRMLKSLPLIVSLTTLVLRDCASLESIAAVGEMKSLEILICLWCKSIKELPEQVRGLNRLKLLEIWGCRNLKRVAAGVISSMVALEELKIVDSFKNWKGGDIHEEEQGNEASLREIESLKKLRSLEIQVSDVALAAQPLHLSPKLAQFAVYFGNPVGDVYRGVPKRGYERRLSLNSGRGHVNIFMRKSSSEDRDVNDGIDWGDFSRNEFLARSDCLYAQGTNNQDFNLNLASAPRLRWLRLETFGNKKNIASVAAAAFPLLEFLSLCNLRNLEEVWDDDDAPIPSNSFKELRLHFMPRLKRIGKCVLSTARDFFLQLETIEIENCEEMEHLLVLVPDEGEQDKEEDSIKTVLIFPKLKKLCLWQLSKLRSIINGGIESIQFPLLTELAIGGDFRNLKWLISRDDEEDDHYQDDDGSLHLFCRPKVSFGNITKLELGWNTESTNVWCNRVPMTFFTGLVELNIRDYKKIRSLCSSKVAQHLVSLQKLEIAWCEEMVKVIEDEEEEDGKSPKKQHVPLFFPSLQHLKLWGLPKLKSFCEWRCALELPALKILRISGCDEMKSFNAAAESVVIAPKLQTSGTSTMDLNSMMSNFLREQRERDINNALRHFEKKERYQHTSPLFDTN